MTVQYRCSKSGYTPIEWVSQEILGNIVRWFLPKDIDELPMAFQAMHNLSQTSKRVYSAVHSDYVSGVFLCSIFMEYEDEDVPKHLFYKLSTFSLKIYIRKK